MILPVENAQNIGDQEDEAHHGAKGLGIFRLTDEVVLRYITQYGCDGHQYRESIADEGRCHK